MLNHRTLARQWEQQSDEKSVKLKGKAKGSEGKSPSNLASLPRGGPEKEIEADLSVIQIISRIESEKSMLLLKNFYVRSFCPIMQKLTDNSL